MSYLTFAVHSTTRRVRLPGESSQGRHDHPAHTKDNQTRFQQVWLGSTRRRKRNAAGDHHVRDQEAEAAEESGESALDGVVAISQSALRPETSLPYKTGDVNIRFMKNAQSSQQNGRKTDTVDDRGGLVGLTGRSEGMVCHGVSNQAQSAHGDDI